MSKFAWVTLTTNDTYSLGALVLANSLRRAGTAHQLAVLVTPGVSESMRNKLKDVYNVVQEVNVLDSQDAANLALLARPELGITFTKLHCWRLMQFEKCVFLDADILVLQNCDELFEREELSAAPDVSWPDCFNSGVFVFKPSLDTFAKITEFAVQTGSFDGGDQGLLNSYFADWAQSDIKKHLPFIYNVTAYASYCYLPAFKQFRDKIKILHFAGKMKPWLIQFNSETKTACTPSDYSHAADLIQLWWNIFCEDVHEKLTDNMKNHYWSVILQWKEFYENNFCHEHHDHHHANQEHHQHVGNAFQPEQPPHSSQMYHVDFEHMKEFCDPWEDYYENLEKQDLNEPLTGFPQVDECAHGHCEDAQSNDCQVVNAFNSTANECSQWEEQNDLTNNADIAPDMSNNNGERECSSVPESSSSTNSSPPPPPPSPPPPPGNDFNANKQLPSQEANSRRSSSVDNTANCKDLLDLKNSCKNEESVAQTEKGSSVQEEAGLAGALSQLRLGEQRSPEQEAYEQLMRRQCWESGQIDYSGKDSFDNIWKKITETLENKPQSAPPTAPQEDKSELLTSADIEDGKIEYDPDTKASIQYKVIEGGYEVITKTPQPNGGIKTQVKTFWDPKPVSEADLAQEQANKKLIKSRLGKEIRIDKHTTMLTREIEGGYEEVYTTVNDDGSRSMRTKTFFDSVPEDQLNTLTNTNKKAVDKKKSTTIRKSSVDSTDSTESRRVVRKQQSTDKQGNFKQETTYEENRKMTQNIEYTENNRTVRKNSLQEQNIKSITSSDKPDGKKKKKTKSSIPPPPADFVQNDTTTVNSKRVPGGVEYTYSTQLESGKTITTTKTVYEEEEVELTEEEIRQYKKTLKDAEKHKNVTTTKKLRSESGTKKVVPSENPGDVTTVETIKIQGGTEYHYTTVTAEGIVKKAVKTIYDPVPSQGNGSDTEEEEIIEDYEEEIIEPGEKNIRTIETIKQLPTKFEEEVTITHEKKEKKVKKSMMISH